MNPSKVKLVLPERGDANLTQRQTQQQPQLFQVPAQAQYAPVGSNTQQWHQEYKGAGDYMTKRILGPYQSLGAFFGDWRHWGRATFSEFTSCMLVCTVVSCAVSVARLGTDVSIQIASVGAVQFLAFLFVYSQRRSSLFPAHANPIITFSENLRGRAPIIPSVFVYYAPAICGSFLSAPLLNALQMSAVPNYATGLNPVSAAGAAGIEIFFGIWVGFAFVQTAIMYASELIPAAEKPSHHHPLNMHALASALVYPIATACTWTSGLYTHGNLVLYMGPALNLGWDIPAGSTYWAHVIFMGTLVCGFGAWLFGVLAWNVADVTDAQFKEAAAVETMLRKKEVIDAQAVALVTEV